MNRNLLDVSIIIPAFNEEEAIFNVVSDLKNNLPKTEIIIVNDGSTDKTLSKIQDLNIQIIHHPYRLGYGASLRSGVEQSTKKYVLFCDADGQHRAKDVIKLIEKCEKYDMVIGSRNKNSHKQMNRLLGKTALRWLANFLMGMKIPDLNSGLRIVKKNILEQYIHLTPHGFSFSTTCTFAFIKDRRIVNWVPIKTNKRIGKSSVSQIKDGAATFLLLIRLSILFEPLKIFLLATSILFLLTISSFLMTIYYHNEFNITDTTVILGLGSLIVFLTGLLCDQVSAIRRKKS